MLFTRLEIFTRPQFILNQSSWCKICLLKTKVKQNQLLVVTFTFKNAFGLIPREIKKGSKNQNDTIL